MCHVLCFVRIIFDNPHKNLKSQHCHSSHFTEKETEALKDTESDLGRLTPGFTYIPLFFTFLTYKSWGRLVICEQDGLGQYPQFYQESFLQWSNQGLKSLMVDSSQFLLWPHLVMLCLLFSETTPSEARICPCSFPFLMDNNPLLS